MTPAGITIGVLDTPSIGLVDATGVVAMSAGSAARAITIDWAYYTDEWHTPTARSARQTTLDGMPVVETRVSVPSGDLIHRVYMTIDAATSAALVIEFENASPGPLAVSLTVPEALVAAAPAWREVEQRGDATVLVWPIPHRATVRAVVPSTDVRAQPSADDVVRGWVAQLERGARIDVDDTRLQQAVDGARAALLLMVGRDRPKPSADEAIALEDWGFDTEALAVWHRLSLRDRRRAGRRGAGRRAPVDDAWARVRAGLAAAPGGVPSEPAVFLNALRRVLVDDAHDHVDVFPGLPADWLGVSVAVHDAPTRHGLVSCALRWHGDRPALLWNAPGGVTLRAPMLDPSWASNAHEGEALLAPPPEQLLKLATARPEGDAIQDPGSFT